MQNQQTITETLKSKEIFKRTISDLLNPKNWDMTDYLLLLANIFTIYWAIRNNFGFVSIVWIYWFQSIIIGFFTIIKIILIKDFTTKGLTINNRPVEESKIGKIKSIIMFIFIYGIFHAVYLIFLLTQSFSQTFITSVRNTENPQFNFSLILIPIIILFLNHLFSFLLKYKEEIKKRKNIGEMIGINILRVFPIHFAIVFGGFFIGFIGLLNILQIIPILIFMSVKTMLDLYTHKMEHFNENNNQPLIQKIK